MLKIMIVEDEEPILRALSDYFTEKGFEVSGRAYNGKQALKLLEKQLCDVVVTDIKMSEMDGLELMRRCAEKHPELKFVVITGNELFDYAKTALNCGALCFVSKFNLFEDLGVAVKRIMKAYHLSEGKSEKAIGLTLEKAKNYIDANLDKKLTVKEIASKFYLSTAYFSKQFTKKFGISCNDYITNEKMKIAETMLETMSVNEVSERLGYLDPKNFRKAFLARYGYYPSELRKKP